MDQPSGRPWIIAHRGASRAHRENSLDAFRAAREMGADAVELDVRRTIDGMIVVHHDDAVAGLGVIADHPFTELREVAAWVPTLAEVIDACRPMWLNVEIKNSPFEPDWDPLDERLADVLAKVPPGTLISSFNPQTVERSRAAPGAHRTGFLVFEGLDPRDVIPAARGCATLNVWRDDLSGDRAAAVVAAAAEANLAVIAWTVDEPAEMRRLADAGVAGIITNIPDLAVAELRR